MLIPTIVMGAFAMIALCAAYSQGKHIEGLETSLKIFLQILPLLFFAMIVAGMMQTLIPANSVAKWVGVESGYKGILLGAVAGGLTPGGPFVSMPIAAGLLKSGAGVGTMVAYITAWSLWAVQRLPLEAGIMGWKFTAVRMVSTFFFPPLAGFIAQMLFSNVDIQ